MFKKILSSLMGKSTEEIYPLAQQNISYILLDMQGTALNNKPLVEQISALKNDYNIKIIACSTDNPQDTEKDLKNMGCLDQFDGTYNGYFGIKLTIPPQMSHFDKSNPDFYSTVKLDGHDILPKDMFLIDDITSNCQAIIEAGGSSHHYFMDERGPAATTKKNKKALQATKSWLKQRNKISPS
jgi:FMN phosphatase YigB (HAD superfamily)